VARRRVVRAGDSSGDSQSARAAVVPGDTRRSADLGGARKGAGFAAKTVRERSYTAAEIEKKKTHDSSQVCFDKLGVV
jgi:hypothetical protein